MIYIIKLTDFAEGDGDRPVLASGPTISESGCGLARRLAEPSDKWENRLTPDKVVLPEHYLNGRITFAAHVRSIGFSKKVRAAADRDEIELICSDGEIQILDRFDGEDEQIVFLPICKTIDDTNGLVSAVGEFCMGPDLVHDGPFDLGKRLSYLSVFDGSPKTLFICANRHGDAAFSAFSGSAIKAGPTIIEGTAQIADHIASQEGDFVRHAPGSVSQDLRAAFCLTFYQGKVGIFVDEGSAKRLKLVDLLVGPFNL